MSDRLKRDIAVEYLDVLDMKGTPDIIAIDCGMKARCATPERPWPFEDACDAALCFQGILDANRRKYAGISVIADTERNLLALRKAR